MEEQGYLAGQFLIAMPGMPDPRFRKTVILICSHGVTGAMGLIINREIVGLSFPHILKQLDIPAFAPNLDDIPIHGGGPVETGRGFVLHSADFLQPASVFVTDSVAMTATLDILKAVADGRGPDQLLMALGYSGWGSGQLEDEILANGWLTSPARDDILFDTPVEDRWPKALAAMGVNAAMLSESAGHA